MDLSFARKLRDLDVRWVWVWVWVWDEEEEEEEEWDGVGVCESLVVDMARTLSVATSEVEGLCTSRMVELGTLWSARGLFEASVLAKTCIGGNPAFTHGRTVYCK